MEIQYETTYYVYITTNDQKNRFEAGVAIDLNERMLKLEYNTAAGACKYLVYYEQYAAAEVSIQRELKLNNLSQRRLKKLAEEKNPGLVPLK